MNKRLLFHAERIGLLMVDPHCFEVVRQRRGKGFSLCTGDGEKIADKALRARVKALAIPPAWQDVRICLNENGHIQAVGRDEKGRLQYRYHDRWVDVRNAVKTERLLRFGHALPRLRGRVAKDLRRRDPSFILTAATATRLIDLEAMRPGHEKYAEDGGRGVASLRKSNLRIVKKTAVLQFVGKSNKAHRVEVKDKAFLTSLSRVRKVRGKRLFQFPGETKKRRRLTAGLLNDYLHEAAGAPISAKDFRTFRGSAEALRFLIEDAEPEASSQAKKKRSVAAAMKAVSEVLRNTPAVARSSYVHPAIITAYEEGTLDPSLFKGRTREGLTREETGLMRFLETHAVDIKEAGGAPSSDVLAGQ
ncbi:DNA topoisomerase IB [Consotaella salsifontis]|uniref:DNA topoisomerase n=1 Tax=Consotaella salsifontis TaxID=1365950 RepID=A0A1T4PZ07_9HYPH|nr:DNA topoisomerase IB [Consotaella salsifontis]SJZ96491.1 DNA topoisomerase-1 [Consotaella salsifontis]